MKKMEKMAKFRKKPVVIEAVRITEETTIDTREGTLKGYPGEWLITGVEGEVYPCGDEIFRKTYEAADEEAAKLLADLREALVGSKRSGLAEKQALKLKTAHPTRHHLTAALRRQGFVKK